MALQRVGKGNYDIEVEGVEDDVLGGQIAHHVAIKGFCVLSPDFYKAELLNKAYNDAEELEFYQVNSVVAEGLLGPEGSCTVADLESNVQKDARSEGASLIAVDEGLTRIWNSLVPHVYQFGIEATRRGNGVAHRAGDAQDESPELTEKEVSKWQGQFLRHSFMILVVLGPKGGDLELLPLKLEDAEPWQVRLMPGQVVVLRADAMTHKYTSSGESLVVSTFLLEPDRKGVPTGGVNMPPAARTIEEWTVNRLKELKDREEDEDFVWDTEIPRGWQIAMNHSFKRGQVSGIAGLSCYFPGFRDHEAWFQASGAGVDFATEVPAIRWQHAAYYDPDPETCTDQRMKTQCKHLTYMEGAELFDNRFFSLSPHESNGMDPHHRLLLELGYLSLHSMGMKKKSLMNAPGGVYVGITSVEFAFAGGIHPQGGSAGISSFASGRISFCLGMKGPSITVSTESASALTATLLAAESVQQKGTAVGTEFATGLAVNLLLSPVWWPNESLQKRLSAEGRCFSFDACADGFIKGDGCAGVGIKPATSIVDGQIVRNEQDNFLASIAGGKLASSGASASMHSTNAAAEQQCMCDAIRNASVAAADVDGIEPFGSGHFLSDAVELSSIWRAHRTEEPSERMAVTAVKSSVGNQVECSGMASIIKVVHAARYGFMSPSLHLKQANPMFDTFEHPLDIMSESLEFPFRSTFNGVKARGLGGSNVYLLSWGILAEQQRFAAEDSDDRFPRKKALPTFWPGGGGELEEHMQPRRKDGYFIAGTWSQWQGGQKMDPEGNDVYTATVTLGENRWEKFQIWLDGDPERALHPGEPKAPQGTAVAGPGTDTGEPTPVASASTLAPSWLLDGRSWLGGPSDGQAEPAAENPNVGEPGEQYIVRLEVAGRWRMVTWEKVATRALQAVAARSSAIGSRSRYFVATSWSGWELEEMTADSATPGLYSIDVILDAYGGGEFQIVRDRDWDQAFYPPYTGVQDGSSAAVLGPDDSGMDIGWLIKGYKGDAFRIEFQRTLESGEDVRKVSWRKL
mmetsp:Transcript_131790/g.328657  ORF Transcript_131790/g.328657 Transcript_131790/m.328657 type:complete len:1027 (+) Transcript_131790:74-3154(+)